MARRIPRSITDKKERTSIKDSFLAMKAVQRFFREIYHSSPKLFIVNVLARLLNAFTPVVILWVGKLIIDENILQVSIADKDLSLLRTDVIVEFSIFILYELSGRLL